MKKIFLRILCLMLFVCCFTVVPCNTAYATGVIEGDEDAGEDTNTIIENDPSDSDVLGITIGTDSESVSSALQIVIVLTVIALCPSILVMLTAFTRILVVLHFTRSALNTQSEEVALDKPGYCSASFSKYPVPAPRFLNFRPKG